LAFARSQRHPNLRCHNCYLESLGDAQLASFLISMEPLGIRSDVTIIDDFVQNLVDEA
jgi:hypothetical protein